MNFKEACEYAGISDKYARELGLHLVWEQAGIAYYMPGLNDPVGALGENKKLWRKSKLDEWLERTHQEQQAMRVNA